MPEPTVVEQPQIDQMEMPEYRQARLDPDISSVAEEAEITPASETGETATEEVKTDPAPEPGQQEEQKPKSKGGFQKRIDKLTSEKYDLQRKVEEYEAKLKTLPPPQPEAKTQEGKPQPETFKTYEEYVDALADWKIEQKMAALQRQEIETAQKEHAKAVFSAHEQRVAEAQERYTDWDDVRKNLDTEEYQVPEAAFFAIPEQENSADVLYYLAQNPDECAELRDLSPVAAASRIGRISAMLAKEEPAPAPKPVTKAPPPVKHVGGSSSKSAVPLDQMDMASFRRARMAQLKRR